MSDIIIIYAVVAGIAAVSFMLGRAYQEIIEVTKERVKPLFDRRD